MRLSSIILFLIFAIQCNILLYCSVADTFVTIPAWVAFGAITTAVKLKLILVKIMFALKTMGFGSIRFKRSLNENGEGILHFSQRIGDTTEYLNAWKDLETTVGRKIRFEVDSCKYGVNYGIPQSPIQRVSSRSLRHESESDSYAQFVSSVIGSLTRNVVACEVLEHALQYARQKTRQRPAT